MPAYVLTIELLNATLPGRGDGVAGYLDVEVQHEDSGLPYLGARSIKGLLVAQCAEILGAPALRDHPSHARLEMAAARLFGRPGSRHEDSGALRISHARLPDDLREALGIAQQADGSAFPREDVIEAFTTIRRQTSVDEETGVAADKTLRAMRVLTAGLKFWSAVVLDVEPDSSMRGLLGACVMGLRAIGRDRARGLGRCEVRLLTGDNIDLTDNWFGDFTTEVR